MGLSAELRSAADVISRIADLRSRGTAATIVGGGTLFGTGNVDVGTVLQTSGLDRIVAHEPADLTCTLEAGVTLAALRDRLARAGQVLPAWHPFPDRATVGGLVAFGWTGLGRRVYGSLRDRVLEVRVVTGEGKAVRGGAKVVKNVTGFDLPRLFCGSMGTLGVICETTLKVHPAPEPLWAATMRGPAAEAIGWAGSTALAAPVPVEAVVEIAGSSGTGWVFVPGPEADARSALPGSPVEMGDEAFLRVASDAILAPDDTQPPAVVRLAVPRSSLAGAVGAVPVARGVVDAASGVAWLGLDRPADVAQLRARAEQLGGSCVLLRAPADLRRSHGTWGSPPPGLEIMRRLKAQFDPDGILGPGRLPV